jgi:predicted component of type VI protein secretion system
MGKLVLFLADGTTLDIPLDRDRTTIGRRAGTDLCLPYAAVSGEHAVVFTTPDGVQVEDLGSTNGTLVNGRRVGRHLLRDGDHIDIGRQKLVYLADADAVVSASSRGHAPAAASEGNGNHRRAPVSAAASGATEAPSSRPEGVVAADADLDQQPMERNAAHAALPSGPVIKVITGPSAGRLLPLTQKESLIGRVGRQVAAVRLDGERCLLLQAEGLMPPLVNGAAVPPEGRDLHSGDEIEVAGVRLAFLIPDATPAEE